MIFFFFFTQFLFSGMLENLGCCFHCRKGISFKIEVHFSNYSYFPSISSFPFSKYSMSFFLLSLAALPHSSFLLPVLSVLNKKICPSKETQRCGYIPQCSRKGQNWAVGTSGPDFVPVQRIFIPMCSPHYVYLYKNSPASLQYPCSVW